MIRLLALCVLLLPPSGAWQQQQQPLLTHTYAELQSSSLSLLGDRQHPDHFRVLGEHAHFVLIGARNKLYNVSVPTMQIKQELRWSNPSCGSLQDAACDNYIRVAVWLESGRLMVCGTNGGSPLRKPECREYTVDPATGAYQQWGKGQPAVGFVPFSYSEPVVLTQAGSRLFTAVRIVQPPGRTAVISAVDEQFNIVRTASDSNYALFDPVFAHSVQYEDKVYFFFRETAIESQRCRSKEVYSRVAQVCISDLGGPKPLQHWASFFKARLRCAVHKDNSLFYFDHLVSVTDVVKSNGSTDMVYAAFNTADNSITGSAVCGFRMADIQKAFEGNFAVESTGWQSVGPPQQFPEPTKCVNDTRSLGINQLSAVDRHRLMYDAVPSMGPQPLFYRSLADERFTHVVVAGDVSAADGTRHDVLFVGTDQGRVLKLSRAAGSTSAVLLETLDVFGDSAAVTELRLVGDSLLVLSAEQVVSLPRERCSKLIYCSECVASRDPYCSWVGNQCRASISGLQDTLSGVHSACPTPATTTLTTSHTTSGTTATTSTSQTTTTTSDTTSSTPATCPPQTPCRCPTCLPTPPPATTNSRKTTATLSSTQGPQAAAAESSPQEAAAVTSETLAAAVSVTALLCLGLGFVLGVLLVWCRQGKLKLLRQRNKTPYTEPKVELQQQPPHNSPVRPRSPLSDLSAPTSGSVSPVNDVSGPASGSTGLRRANKPPPLQLLPTVLSGERLSTAPVNGTSTPTTATTMLYRTPSTNQHNGAPPLPATPIKRVPSTPTRVSQTPNKGIPTTPTKLAPHTPKSINDFNINVLRNDVNMLNSSLNGSLNGSFQPEGNVCNASTLERTKKSNKIYV